MVEALFIDVELVARAHPFSAEILLGLVILMKVVEAECFSLDHQVANFSARHFLAVFIDNF